MRGPGKKLVRPGEDPRAALFRHILRQAIEDATMAISDKVKEAQRRNLQRIRDQARAWLESQNERFRLCCESAGVEASRVHQFAMMRIRESIQREHVRTAELLTSTPGGVRNFQMEVQDRPINDTREIEEIEIRQNEVSPS